MPLSFAEPDLGSCSQQSKSAGLCDAVRRGVKLQQCMLVMRASGLRKLQDFAELLCCMQAHTLALNFRARWEAVMLQKC